MKGENIVKKEQTIKIKEETIYQFNGDHLGVWTEPEPSENKEDSVQFNKDDLKTIDEDDYDDYSDGEVKHEPSIDSSIDKESLQECQYSQDFSKRCKFKCPDCGKTCTSFNNMRDHFLKQHRKKTPIEQAKKFMYETVYHKCYVCSSDVLCDNVFLRRHFVKHKLTVGEYKDTFKVDIAKSVGVVYSNDSIGNFCIYECKVCKQHSYSRTHMQRHMQATSHGKSKDAVKNMIKSVYHKCKLCNLSIVCENIALQLHFRSVHKTSREEYCKKTGCFLAESKYGQQVARERKRQNQDKHYDKLCQGAPVSQIFSNFCKFKCQDCAKICQGEEGIRIHMSRNHKKNLGLKQLLKIMCKTVSYVCCICNMKVLCDYTFLRRHLKRHCLTVAQYKDKFSLDSLKESALEYSMNVIGNLCLYKCLQCDEQSFYLGMLQKHKEVFKHGDPNDLTNNIVRPVHHKCKICLKTLLCVTANLRTHIRKIHNLSLQEYCNKFGCTFSDGKKNGQYLIQSLKISPNANDLCQFFLQCLRQDV